MATETFVNNAQTTLNGSVASSDLTITVTSPSAFPTSGNFRIIIDSEIMVVTYVTGSVFTVLRGQESTTAASHTNASLVTQVLTAGALTGAFARLDQPNDDSLVNGPNQLAQLDSSGLLPESATADLRYMFRLLLLSLMEEGFELPGELIEEVEAFTSGSGI